MPVSFGLGGDNYEPMLAQAAAPQVGVQQPPAFQRRPGIQTAVYRTEPGTREFVMDEANRAPIAAGSLQDRISQVLQRAQLLEDAGGTPDNSPQLRSLVVQHDALQQALNQQMQAQAEMVKGNAQQAQVDQANNPEFFKKQVFLKQLEANTASQGAIAAHGGSVNPAAYAAELGYDKIPLAQALRGLSGGAVDPSTRAALMSAYGPLISARQRGEPTNYLEKVPFGLSPNMLQGLPDPRVGEEQAVRQVFGAPQNMGPPPVAPATFGFHPALSLPLALTHMLSGYGSGAPATGPAPALPPAPVTGPAGPVGPPPPPVTGPAAIPGIKVTEKAKKPAIFRGPPALPEGATVSIADRRKARDENSSRIAAGR